MIRFRTFAATAALLALTAQTSTAQDRIITKEGEVINGYNVEVGENTVFYSETASADAAVKRLPKADLLMIRRANGEKVNFTANSAAQPAAQPAPTEQPQPTTATSPASEARNKELIAKYNADDVTYTNEKKKAKGKTAKAVYCQFFATDDSRLCDDNVDLEFSMAQIEYEYIDKRFLSSNYDIKIKGYKDAKSPFYNPAIKVTVKNNSDKTIFLDLGNSFFTRHGEASPYYVPMATSTGSNSSSGAGVNLGSVAGALGLGGTIGQLAGGVNVGGSSGTNSSTVVYSQRVISIPPHSQTSLEPQALIPADKKDPRNNRKGESLSGECFATSNFNGGTYNWSSLSWPEARENELLNGTVWHYNEADPFSKLIPRYGVYVTYSQDEAFTTPHTLNANLYIGKIIGGDEDDISPNHAEKIGITAYIRDLK